MRKAGDLPAHFDIHTRHFVTGETTWQTGENLAGERADLPAYYSANLNNGSENSALLV